jgi:hypothetical protein
MTFLEFYIVPNMQPKTNVATSRKSKLDSTLIESNHIPLFCFMDLIENILHYYNIIPCQFKLLYRSNWDRFDAASFHKHCDNKRATIWIAKIKGSNN